MISIRGKTCDWRRCARSIDVYRPGEAVATLGDENALDGLDVLPGFACEVSAAFGPRPAGERPQAAP